MTPVVDHSLEIALLGVFACVLSASFFVERQSGHRKAFTWILLALALLSVGNFYNFGSFGQGRGHVHHWEHFHHYLGSKYLSELRYDAIYEAAILASNENGYLLDVVMRYRDPVTFRLRRTPIPLGRQATIRERFTPARWQEFKRDVLATFRQLSYVKDHGNTGSPSWAMTAGLFTSALPYGTASSRVLANLDALALLILFVTVWRTFGGRALALTMIVGLSAPLVYRYLGGSILRMDWICVLGMSVCMFEKHRYRTAGILLGYAVACKLLAGVMVLPLGIRFVIQTIRDRRIDPDQLRYVLFAFLGLGSFVVLSGLYFGDIGLWRDYYRRILVTFHENYYPTQHSLRDLFLQAVYLPDSVWNPLPKFVASKYAGIAIENVRGAFVAVQLIMLGGLGFVASRHPARVAFALGPLAVFVLLVTHRYYWQMWLIPALVLAPIYVESRRHAAFLTAIVAWLGAVQAIELTTHGFSKGGYFGSYLLFCLCVWLVGFESVSWYRERRSLGR